MSEVESSCDNEASLICSGKTGPQLIRCLVSHNKDLTSNCRGALRSFRSVQQGQGGGGQGGGDGSGDED